MELIMKKEDLSVWLLSAVPLLASIVLHIAAGSSPVVFTVVFLLNLAFVSYDYFKNRSSMGYPFYVYLSGLVFIPLYIYFRTISDRHQYRFLVTWLILYVLDMAFLQMSVL